MNDFRLTATSGTQRIRPRRRHASNEEDVMQNLQAYRFIGSVLASVSISALLVSLATATLV